MIDEGTAEGDEDDDDDDDDEPTRMALLWWLKNVWKHAVFILKSMCGRCITYMLNCSIYFKFEVW